MKCRDPSAFCFLLSSLLHVWTIAIGLVDFMTSRNLVPLLSSA